MVTCTQCRTAVADAVSRCPSCKSPLSYAGADLSGRDLTGADLAGVDLRGAKLVKASLGRVRLAGADLSSADLTGADLRGAVLIGANLEGADLSGADLCGADLHEVRVKGANLHRAAIDQAYLTALRKYKGTPAWTAPGAAPPLAPGKFRVANRESAIVCAFCGGDEFEVKHLVLSTRGLAFFDLEWLGQGSYVLTCRTCGHLEWFAKAPLRAGD